MKIARILALFLIVVQAIVVGWFFSSFGLPAAAVLFSLLAVLQPPREDTRTGLWVILALLVSALFLLSWRIGLFDRIRATGFLEASFTFAVASLFLFLQALTLMTRRELPPIFLLWATGTLVNAGSIYTDPVQTVAYEAVSFGVLAGFSIALGCQTGSPPVGWTGRTLRACVVGACLTAVWYLTAFSVQTVIRHRQKLDDLFRTISIPYAIPSAPGFSRSGEIGTISWMKFSRTANRVALRVFSDSSPGHLRGMAFDQYGHNGWQEAHRERTPLSAEFPAPRGTSRNRFVLRQTGADGWIELRIWPSPEIEEGIFAPMEAAVGEFPVTILEQDSNGVLDSGELVGGVDYALFSPVLSSGGESPGVHWHPPTQAHLTLPGHLDPRIAPLAREITRSARTTGEKIQRVVDYLSGYSYRIFRRGRPYGTDRLAFFLFESREGHCELFATAAAILLREAGVPTRYVTGFLVSERNPAGYWVARNRDAHAWVEAWDPETGWVTVDPTPAEGVPRIREMPGFAALIDRIKLGLQRFVATARVDGLPGIWQAFLHGIARLAAFLMSDQPAAVGCRIGLLILLFLFLVRYHRRIVAAAAGDPNRKALAALLAAMDWRMRLRGLVRRPTETIRQFASRIVEEVHPAEEAKSVAAWYIDYANVRYGGHLLAGHVEHLRKTMPRLQIRLPANGRGRSNRTVRRP